MEQIPGPFGYSWSTCDRPLCMLKKFFPETEAPIGSLITFKMESPSWAGQGSPVCLQNSSSVWKLQGSDCVVQWVAQASILGPGWASEGDFSEIWDMFWKEHLVASTEQGQGVQDLYNARLEALLMPQKQTWQLFVMAKHWPPQRSNGINHDICTYCNGYKIKEHEKCLYVHKWI